MIELTLNNGITMPALGLGVFQGCRRGGAAEELARIDALDTGVRSGPDPDVPRPELFARVIPEA